MPELIGGSADLTASNNTKTKGIDRDHAETSTGRYIHYGIREHGMAAAMNGMALHGGFIPYRRHLPRLHRLCAARDPARRADGRAASSTS